MKNVTVKYAATILLCAGVAMTAFSGDAMAYWRGGVWVGGPGYYPYGYAGYPAPYAYPAPYVYAPPIAYAPPPVVYAPPPVAYAPAPLIGGVSIRGRF